MGALRRATRSEVEECAKDPEWYPDLLARIADGGSLGELVAENRWSWGALWAWIQSDEERNEAYDSALKARAQRLMFDGIDEATQASVEDVAVRKLRSDVFFKAAGKFDRPRYGDSTKHEVGGVIGLSLMTVLSSLPRAGMERVVEEVPAQVPSKATLVQYEEV